MDASKFCLIDDDLDVKKKLLLLGEPIKAKAETPDQRKMRLVSILKKGYYDLVPDLDRHKSGSTCTVNVRANLAASRLVKSLTDSVCQVADCKRHIFAPKLASSNFSLVSSVYASERPITAIAYNHRTGLVAAGDVSGSLRLQHLDDLDAQVAHTKPCGALINRIEPLNDGFVSCDSDGLVLYSCLKEGQSISEHLYNNCTAVSSLSLSSSHSVLIFSDSAGLLKLMDLSTRELLLSCRLFSEPMSCAHQSPSHPYVIAAGSHSGSMRLFDARLGRSIWSFTGSEDKVNDVYCHPLDVIYVADNSGAIHSYEIRSLCLLNERLVHETSISQFAFAPEDIIFTSSLDQTLGVIDMHSLRVKQILRGHDEKVLGLCQAKEGSILSCGYDRTVKKWQKDDLLSL